MEVDRAAEEREGLHLSMSQCCSASRMLEERLECGRLPGSETSPHLLRRATAVVDDGLPPERRGGLVLYNYLTYLLPDVYDAYHLTSSRHEAELSAYHWEPGDGKRGQSREPNL